MRLKSRHHDIGVAARGCVVHESASLIATQQRAECRIAILCRRAKMLTPKGEGAADAIEVPFGDCALEFTHLPCKCTNACLSCASACTNHTMRMQLGSPGKDSAFCSHACRGVPAHDLHAQGPGGCPGTASDPHTCREKAQVRAHGCTQVIHMPLAVTHHLKVAMARRLLRAQHRLR